MIKSWSGYIIWTAICLMLTASGLYYFAYGDWVDAPELFEKITLAIGLLLLLSGYSYLAGYTRLMTAILLTAFWVPVTLFSAGYFMMGDCSVRVELCLQDQRLTGWMIVGSGLAILTSVYYLIFRLRRR